MSYFAVAMRVAGWESVLRGCGTDVVYWGEGEDEGVAGRGCFREMPSTILDGDGGRTRLRMGHLVIRMADFGVSGVPGMGDRAVIYDQEWALGDVRERLDGDFVVVDATRRERVEHARRGLRK